MKIISAGAQYATIIVRYYDYKMNLAFNATTVAGTAPRIIHVHNKAFNYCINVR